MATATATAGDSRTVREKETIITATAVTITAMSIAARPKAPLIRRIRMRR